MKRSTDTKRMIDAVHRYEGTLNQLMGDEIIALFSALMAHKDHAIRACYAAEAVGLLAQVMEQITAVEKP